MNMIPAHLQKVWADPFFKKTVQAQLADLKKEKERAVERVQKKPYFGTFLERINSDDGLRSGRYYSDGEIVFSESVYNDILSGNELPEKYTISWESLQRIGFFDPPNIFHSNDYQAELSQMFSRSEQRIWAILGRLFWNKTFYYPASSTDFYITNYAGKKAQFIFQDSDIKNIDVHEFLPPIAKSRTHFCATNVTNFKNLTHDLNRLQADVLIFKNAPFGISSKKIIAMFERTIFKKKKEIFVIDFDSEYSLPNLKGTGYSLLPLPKPIENARAEFFNFKAQGALLFDKSVSFHNISSVPRIYWKTFK